MFTFKEKTPELEQIIVAKIKGEEFPIVGKYTSMGDDYVVWEGTEDWYYYAEELEWWMPVITEKKAFVVYYGGGQWEDSWKQEIFVTLDKQRAETYVNKANTMLKKWKKYWNDKYDNDNTMNQHIWERFCAFEDLDNFWMKETKLR